MGAKKSFFFFFRFRNVTITRLLDLTDFSGIGILDLNMKMLPRLSHVRQPSSQTVGWSHPPTPGTPKLNFDGSFTTNGLCIGGIITDYNDLTVKYFSDPAILVTANEAEVLALLQGSKETSAMQASIAGSNKISFCAMRWATHLSVKI